MAGYCEQKPSLKRKGGRGRLLLNSIGSYSAVSSRSRGFFFTGFVYERQPVSTKRCGSLGKDDVEEFLLQPLGDRSAFARSDRDPIDRTDRRNLGCGSSEEHLVREV